MRRGLDIALSLHFPRVNACVCVMRSRCGVLIRVNARGEFCCAVAAALRAGFIGVSIKRVEVGKKCIVII